MNQLKLPLRNLNSLELFCGTKSFSKEIKKLGATTVTLDNRPLFKPYFLMDVRDFSMTHVPYNILWASPPCQGFSLMSASKYWSNINGTCRPTHDKSREAVELVRKTLSIIESYLRFEPFYWFIENPRGMLGLVMDDLIKETRITDYVKRTVTYCQYGEKNMKPTNIWTNLRTWKPRPACSYKDNCHEKVSSKKKTGTIALPTAIHRAVVPKELCSEIAQAIVNEVIK